MVHQIKGISILQTSKLVVVLWALLAPIYLLFSFLAQVLMTPVEQLGIWAWLLFPLFFVVFSFGSTALACAIYNRVAKLMGGIEVTLVATE